MENENSEITEQIEQNETAEQETESLPELVDNIRQHYESLIAEMSAKHAQAIKERDAIITQLITSDSDNQPAESFVDNINKKRNYKKW